MDIQKFKEIYVEEIKKYGGDFEDHERACKIAEKMTIAVKTGPKLADWWKDNEAMKRAAKRYGFKTSKQFRETLMSQRANE